jgi:hypothetical protein
MVGLTGMVGFGLHQIFCAFVYGQLYFGPVGGRAWTRYGDNPGGFLVDLTLTALATAALLWLLARSIVSWARERRSG